MKITDSKYKPKLRKNAFVKQSSQFSPADVLRNHEGIKTTETASIVIKSKKMCFQRTFKRCSG